MPAFLKWSWLTTFLGFGGYFCHFSALGTVICSIISHTFLVSKRKTTDCSLSPLKPPSKRAQMRLQKLFLLEFNFIFSVIFVDNKFPVSFEATNVPLFCFVSRLYAFGIRCQKAVSLYSTFSFRNDAKMVPEYFWGRFKDFKNTVIFNFETWSWFFQEFQRCLITSGDGSFDLHVTKSKWQCQPPGEEDRWRAWPPLLVNVLASISLWVF